MERRLNMRLSRRLLLLLCLMLLGVIATSILLLFVPNGNLFAMLTMQDILAFILPAVVTMAIIYHRPFHVMGLDRAPSWLAITIVIVFYVISLPAMNWLVEMNKAMSLPSWMAGIEQAMRAAEDNAAEVTQEMLNINSVGQLILCVLVVGVMAGLSEEMLFRGALLRTMQDSRLGKHAVVWITAFLFSALHMQFYGFVPRMLLGVWLGYLFVWTGSLWVPIIAHTLNNSTVVLMSYLSNKGVIPEGFGDNLGLPAAGSFPWLATCSLIASLALAISVHVFYTSRRKT
ncbi:MAG: CPBP family intramembrane metalloprotease [Muribaculaceae bacterium]|nr:CPBP family intramembrane metalloprotease [Muribaculaceae bacterium]